MKSIFKWFKERKDHKQILEIAETVGDLYPREPQETDIQYCGDVLRINEDACSSIHIPYLGLAYEMGLDTRMQYSKYNKCNCLYSPTTNEEEWFDDIEEQEPEIDLTGLF